MTYEAATELKAKLPKGVRVTNSMNYGGCQTWTIGQDGVGIIGHLHLDPERYGKSKPYGYSAQGDYGKSYTRAAAIRNILRGVI